MDRFSIALGLEPPKDEPSVTSTISDINQLWMSPEMYANLMSSNQAMTMGVDMASSESMTVASLFGLRVVVNSSVPKDTAYVVPHQEHTRMVYKIAEISADTNPQISNESTSVTKEAP
jgi:hypothetical protein